MRIADRFYLIFIFTVIVIRALVFIYPEVDVVIFGEIVHHFWLGIFLLFVSFLSLNNLGKLLFSIGLGLVADQIVFILLGAGRDPEYWHLYSVIGMLVAIVIIYSLRGKLVNIHSNIYKQKRQK